MSQQFIFLNKHYQTPSLSDSASTLSLIVIILCSWNMEERGSLNRRISQQFIFLNKHYQTSSLSDSAYSL